MTCGSQRGRKKAKKREAAGVFKDQYKLKDETDYIKAGDAKNMARIQDKLNNSGGDDVSTQAINKMFLTPEHAFAKRNLAVEDAGVGDYINLTLDYTKSIIGDNNPNNMVQSYNFSKFGRGTRSLKPKSEYVMKCYDIDTLDDNGYAVERELDTYIDGTTNTVPVFEKGSKYQNGLISMFVGKIFGVGDAMNEIKTKVSGDIKPACKKVKVQIRKPNMSASTKMHDIKVGDQVNYLLEAGEIDEDIKVSETYLSDNGCKDEKKDTADCQRQKLVHERLKHYKDMGQSEIKGVIIEKNSDGNFKIKLESGRTLSSVPPADISTSVNPEGYNVNNPFKITYEDAYLSTDDIENYYKKCTANNKTYNPSTFSTTGDYGKCLKNADGSDMTSIDVHNNFKAVKRKKRDGIIPDNSIKNVLSNPMGFVKTGDAKKKVGNLKADGSGYESKGERFSNMLQNDLSINNDVMVLGQKVLVGVLHCLYYTS